MSYKELKSYQQAEIVCDFTVEFCDRYIESWPEGPDYRTYKTYKSYKNKSYRTYSRQSDQMLQAARSGKQNIVEGAKEDASKQSAIKLTSVARASFQELLEDYEDFLRQKGLRHWPSQSADAQAVRALAYRPHKTYRAYKPFLAEPETAANAMICLINQTNFLLDQQIKSMEKDFVEKGGFRENLRKAREEEKKKQVYRKIFSR